MAALTRALLEAAEAEQARQDATRAETLRLARAELHPVFRSFGEARAWAMEDGGSVVRKYLRAGVTPTQARLRALVSQACPGFNPATYDPLDHALVSPFVVGRHATAGEVEAARANAPRYVGDLRPSNAIVGEAGPLVVDFSVRPGAWVRAASPEWYRTALGLLESLGRPRPRGVDPVDVGWVHVEGRLVREPWDAVAGLVLALPGQRGTQAAAG